MVKMFSRSVFLMVLGIAAALFISACVEPLNIEEFINNEKVQNIINKERVGLKNYTGHTLTAGNERITGLNPERYYMVEILDENGDQFIPQEIWFVDGSGYLALDFEDIRRVSGGIIRNLDNDLIYAVYSAPITGNLTLYDQVSLPPGTGVTVAANANGIISPVLQAPKNNYYLELPSSIDLSCNILMFPVVPIPGDPDAISFEPIIELEGEGTTTDYVFYDSTSHNEPLRFLRVAIAAEIPPVDIIINITFGVTGDLGESLIFSPPILTVSQDTLLAGGLQITINGSNFVPGNVEWWFDGVSIQTGASFTMLGSDNIEYLVLGSKEFTLEFEIDSVRYSKILRIVVE